MKRATTCWKAQREGDKSKIPLVIKYSWQYPERENEGRLLLEATEKRVVNRVRHNRYEIRVSGLGGQLYQVNLTMLYTRSLFPRYFENQSNPRLILLCQFLMINLVVRSACKNKTGAWEEKRIICATMSAKGMAALDPNGAEPPSRYPPRHLAFVLQLSGSADGISRIRQ